MKEVSWTSLPPKKFSEPSKHSPVRQVLPVLLPSLEKKIASPDTQLNSPKVQAPKESKSIPPILKLVPTQVKGARKKIVFHSKKW